MLERISDLARLITIVVLVTLVLAALAEWAHGSEPLTALPAIFAAIVLMLAAFLVPAAAGIALGMWLARKSKLRALGWVAGIVTWCALAWPADHLAKRVPGIGWRIAAMQAEAE